MSVELRPFRAADAAAVLALADRLTTGVAQWRDPAAVATAVRAWVEDSVADARTTVFVAADGHDVCGFVTVKQQTHWTGERDGYIGELVVAEGHEGQGLGRRLVAAAEGWARQRGLGRIRLSTGAANAGALALYDRLGYEREDVTLSRSLASEWEQALEAFVAAAPPGLRWLLVGSAASALQGADVLPGDVDVLVHPETTDEDLEPLGSALVRYAVGPATAASATFRSTPEQPWMDAGAWRFGRWMVAGCKLEVARIREGVDGDALVETLGHGPWGVARTEERKGRRVPVVPLEVQLATIRSRGLTEREAAVRRVLDERGWDRALYTRACAAQGIAPD